VAVNRVLTESEKIYTIFSMGKVPPEDPVMEAIRNALEASGMSRQDVGEKMGHSASSARQAVSQMLKGHDVRVGTVRRFAKALGVPLSRLIR
jgi:transcriptional regulator with XRE-family HTH domain